MNEYEINSSTLAIIPLDESTSKVYEEEVEYIIKRSSNSIIKDNCYFYGSSYAGRCDGTKKLTGIKSKFPIIIEESRNIIFFPTTSSRTQQSSWIALNQVEKLNKKNLISQIEFKNSKTVTVNISYYSLENQFIRASMLKSKLYERKLDKIEKKI